MDHHLQRRKSRAIAVSETVQARRQATASRVLIWMGLAFGVADAVWVLNHVLAGR